MADLIFAEEVRQYLIDEGVVSAIEDGDTTPPPCVVDPDDGVHHPTPTDADKLVAILTGLEIANPWLESRFLQDIPLEIVVRAATKPECNLLQRVIRGKMIEKENILMGQLLIERSSHFRGEQTIAHDQETWTTSQSFRVSCRVASLTV